MIYSVGLDYTSNRWSCSYMRGQGDWTPVFSSRRVVGNGEFILCNEMARKYQPDNQKKMCTGGTMFIKADAAYIDTDDVMRFVNGRPVGEDEMRHSNS